MSDQEFVIALAAIAFGTGLALFVLGNIFSIIKKWIERNNKSSEMTPELLKALSDFRKNAERRITNLEAIVSDWEEEKILISNKVPKKDSVEIDEEKPSDQGSDSSREHNNLKNMLR